MIEASSRVIIRQTRIHIKSSPLISLAVRSERDEERKSLFFMEALSSHLFLFSFYCYCEKDICEKDSLMVERRGEIRSYMYARLILSYTGHAVRDVYAGRRMPKRAKLPVLPA